MAPTYVANVVAFIFIAARLMGWEIPYTSVEVENAITIFVVLATPLFTAFRQLLTGRATLLGAKPATDLDLVGY